MTHGEYNFCSLPARKFLESERFLCTRYRFSKLRRLYLIPASFGIRYAKPHDLGEDHTTAHIITTCDLFVGRETFRHAACSLFRYQVPSGFCI